ncbi:hypothetical protein KEM09_00715 [Carboxylicivirga mesophila]|uniref:Tetratricopeptide repeat protein n=1 Tax=Carboxylicivirga mesophila TaxID=1166478 RepID=A0ABS5K4E9_9BACT|nr:hypothetical protein [Carboxylicivirga mesophila]MBS2209906.1 hypothetical protein [Carboxylicivirga mesophila]
MKHILTVFFITAFALQLSGQSSYLLSPQGQATLHQIYQTPQANLHQFESRNNPSIEDEYLRLYGLFMTYQANEQSIHANSFHQGLKHFETHFNDDERFHLMQVTLLIQQSLLYWSNEAYTDGVRAFYKAHRVFARADRANFQYDYDKINGLFNVFLSQIPEQYRFWASLFGLQGDADKGLQLLRNNLQNSHLNEGARQEALVAYSYCLLKFGEPDKTEIIQLMASSQNLHSPVLSFVIASLAIKKQLGTEGLSYVENLPYQTYQAFPLLYHVKGRLLLNQLDSAATNSLHTFTKLYKGQSFRTDALMRQAWWWHIQQNLNKRDSLIMLAKQQTVFSTSNDKQAQKELVALPDEPVTLLKARLLFDGGYYEKAQAALMSSNTSQLSRYYLPEYHYRLGRINQALNKHQDAQKDYDIVISLCQDDKRYIGPYAAIESAKIYLSQNDSTKAQQYLQQAHQLNTGEYKQDISRTIASLIKQ